MAPTIDVVIPTLGRPASAARVVSAVSPQLGSGDTLCVVWQGTAKPAIIETGMVRLVRSAPPGLPRARNAGIRFGRGDIVLFLDDDVDPHPGLLTAHRNGFLNPLVGAVAGRLDDPLFTPDNEEIAAFDETTGRLLQNFCAKERGFTISVMGANMSFRRTALDAIGLFDENFLHNALREEVDAAFRLRAAGYKILYCPLARVTHLREPDEGCRSDPKPLYLYHEFANIAYFGARHAQKKYWRSWFTYWKYRLEYESRKRVLWLKHDPLLVATGALGACAGAMRFALRGRKPKSHDEIPAGGNAARP